MKFDTTKPEDAARLVKTLQLALEIAADNNDHRLDELNQLIYGPPPNGLTECLHCKRPPDAVNHVDGHHFVGWGHGWQPCIHCKATQKVPARIPRDTPDADLKEYIFQYIASHPAAQKFDCCVGASPFDLDVGENEGKRRLLRVGDLTQWLIDNGYIIQKGRWLYTAPKVIK